MKFAIAIVAASLAATAQAGCFGDNPRPEPLTFDEKVELHSYNYDPTPVPNDANNVFPQHWDWCDVHGKSYCAPSWNQHIPKYCGGCWLHATLSHVQDRIKLMKNGEGLDVMLARQTLLQCGPLANLSNGCKGGLPSDVFHYMQEFGLPDEGCMLYKADDSDFMHLKDEGKQCPPAGICRNCMSNHDPVCFDLPNPLLYSLKSFGPIQPGEHAMMAEIFARGPIVCSMATSWDFDYGYNGGVYVDVKKNATDPDHEVEIVGWGVDIQDGEPIKYWKVRNSWGTYWGELGFFRIRRGTNENRIEDDCWYSVPDISMERKVINGKLVGDMVKGLIPNPRHKHTQEGAVRLESDL